MKKNFKFFVLVLVLAIFVSSFSFLGETSYAESKNAKKAKYVFLFIGDGMGAAQVNAAQIYTGNKDKVEIKPLEFYKFPTVGLVNTEDSTSFCPDSASTATAISSGAKTQSGVIGKTSDLQKNVTTVAEKMKAQGKKIGIISTVTLNHATPAAFYANVTSRKQYYEIGKQMAASGFDYFAGGSLEHRTGDDKNKKEKDLYDILRANGYTVTETKKDFEKINKNTGKVFAVTERIQDSGSMPYTLDQKKGDMTLRDTVRKAIEVLDNEKGFFIMAEAGKVDWACHANDAFSSIHEVLALDDAVQEAIEFYKKHPDETLILVTADHETGGLSLGYQGTGYDTHFEIFDKQKLSYVEFDKKFEELKKNNKNLKFEDALKLVKESFGLIVKDKNTKKEDELFVLNDYELGKLKAAFAESMKEKDKRTKSIETNLLYGGYDPFSATLTHIIDNKAGIGWSTFAHTAVPVPIYALGATAELYEGTYHDSEIYSKLMESLGAK